jgi:hypothetical protein
MPWIAIADEELALFSPIGLRLVDDFTGRVPFGKVKALLDFQDVSGDWHETEQTSVRTPSEIITYPGLGRNAKIALQPVFRYRVRIDAQFYRADYLKNEDGVEFDVHPWDDNNPPAVIPNAPQDLILLPATQYPFSAHIRVSRGVVVDNVGTRVPNVEVRQGNLERTLTDDRGMFSLPLRWPALNAALQIDALDHRTARNGQINITLPGDLDVGHSITIT